MAVGPRPARDLPGIDGVSDTVPVTEDTALRIVRTLGGSTL